MTKKTKSPFITLLAVILLLTSLSGCVQQKPDETLIEEAAFFNLLPEPDKSDLSMLPTLNTGLTSKIKEKSALNDDTLGWLKVDNTSLDDEVMFRPLSENNTDKHYYLRRDFNGNSYFNGSYYLDYRTKFEGGREGMSSNNVIYGHSMTDNPNDTIFSQLKKYQNIDFAKDNPYIYFSTKEEDMAWEVFAIYETKVDFVYNQPNPEKKDFVEIVERAKNKSWYDFNVDVAPEDKILTLSTCLYRVNGKPISYPNDYRYVVMAKLVPAREILRKTSNVAEKTEHEAA